MHIKFLVFFLFLSRDQVFCLFWFCQGLVQGLGQSFDPQMANPITVHPEQLTIWQKLVDKWFREADADENRR